MLTAQSVIDNFLLLSQIPRPSKKEEKVRKFLRDWAVWNSLIFQEDEIGNIITFVPGKGEKSNHETLAFQSHIDMVCVRDKDSDHDFNKNALQILEDNGKISAKGTTLGADNGIGVAMMMSMIHLEDCPPLELVFTVDEEEGMTGAESLDLTLLKANKLINLDWEETETMCVGCAGGIFLGAEIPLVFQSPEYKNQYKIDFYGMKWGHSGDSIHTPVGNAVIAFSQFLQYNYESIELTNLEGGMAVNAIPTRASSIVGVDGIMDLEKSLKSFISEYQKSFDAPDLTYKITPQDTVQNVIKDFAAYLEIVLSVGTGVVKFYEEDVTSIQTSFNLGQLSMSSQSMNLNYLMRSSVENELDILVEKFSHIFGRQNVTTKDRYPSWEGSIDAPFSQKILKSIQEGYPKMKAINIHAGLECGIFAQNRPDLQMASFGPTISDPHTTRESIYRRDIEIFVDYINLVVKGW